MTKSKYDIRKRNKSESEWSFFFNITLEDSQGDYITTDMRKCNCTVRIIQTTQAKGSH